MLYTNKLILGIYHTSKHSNEDDEQQRQQKYVKSSITQTST